MRIQNRAMNKIIRKIDMELGNRDGDLHVVETDDGRFYLVLTAETMHVPEEFDGMGSAFCIEITRAAFDALTNDQASPI